MYREIAISLVAFYCIFLGNELYIYHIFFMTVIMLKSVEVVSHIGGSYKLGMSHLFYDCYNVKE